MTLLEVDYSPPFEADATVVTYLCGAYATSGHRSSWVTLSYCRVTDYRPAVLIGFAWLSSFLYCFRGNILDIYFGCSRFESRPRQRLFSVFYFPQSFQTNTGIVSRLGHDRFLLSYLQFALLSSYHSSPHSL